MSSADSLNLSEVKRFRFYGEGSAVWRSQKAEV